MKCIAVADAFLKIKGFCDTSCIFVLYIITLNEVRFACGLFLSIIDVCDSALQNDHITCEI